MGYEAMKGVVLLGLVAVALVGAVGAVQPGKPVVPAVFVLGDSTLDVGNNNHLPGKDVPRANMPFYGIDFPGGHRPTGRFSNGYNIADFIGNNIPLSKQLRYFASTKSEMEAAWGTHKVSMLLANSFFLLGISNDLFHTNPKTPAEVAALYTTLVSNYSAVIADLYGMGARKFGIINVGPIGCVPRVRVLNATGACNDALNRYAFGFAAAVKSALAELATKLPGFAYSLADSFTATQASFSNPQALGFMNSDTACCGTGRLGAEGGELCKRNDTLCADRDTYVYWDSVHSTQRAAELGAQGLFEGPTLLTVPINFKQLAYKRY